MRLSYYTERQEELNKNLVRHPNYDELQMAIIAELGELCNELKYGDEGWCWWPRAGKSRNDDAIIGELIDLLHFLLVGYNDRHQAPQDYHQSLLDDQRSAFVDHRDQFGEIQNLSHELLKQSFMGRFHLAISLWYEIALSLGFSDQQLQDAFEVSYQKNVARWT